MTSVLRDSLGWNLMILVKSVPSKVEFFWFFILQVVIARLSWWGQLRLKTGIWKSASLTQLKSRRTTMMTTNMTMVIFISFRWFMLLEFPEQFILSKVLDVIKGHLPLLVRE